MTKIKSPTVHAERPTPPITDTERIDAAAALQASLTTSDLVKNSPAMQANIAQLGNIAKLLPAASALVETDRKTLVADTAARDKNRTDFDRLFNLHLDMLEHDALTEKDLKDAHVTPRGEKPPATPPATPLQVDVKIPKRARGYAVASVHETGRTRGAYDAQYSPDPYGPSSWLDLVGHGKSRRVTGASGTKVWIRFAQVKRGVRSEWSTPVLITIP
jgi:hypothetical protein